MLLYRIAKRQYIEDLSGYGSRLYGGRWNEKGYSALYTSSSLALCMCETLVHCDKSIIPQNMFFAEMEFPDELIPSKFITIPEGFDSITTGTQWLKSRESVCIKAHSVIFPAEYNKDFNIIFNPEHPDFQKLKINKIVECPFDLRLF